jgi:hypothetical protein
MVCDGPSKTGEDDDRCNACKPGQCRHLILTPSGLSESYTIGVPVRTASVIRLREHGRRDTRPINTAFTTGSAFRYMPHGLRSRGSVAVARTLSCASAAKGSPSQSAGTCPHKPRVSVSAAQSMSASLRKRPKCCVAARRSPENRSFGSRSPSAADADSDAKQLAGTRDRLMSG